MRATWLVAVLLTSASHQVAQHSTRRWRPGPTHLREAKTGRHRTPLTNLLRDYLPRLACIPFEIAPTRVPTLERL